MENVKYVKCECGKAVLNPYFQTPSFDEIEFAEAYDLTKIPDSVYNMAVELVKKIDTVELLGNNDCVVRFSAKVCQSKNETILMSNLTNMNQPTSTIRFNFKYSVCKDYGNVCDYSYACPIRIATYLYLVQQHFGEAHIKELRKAAKKNQIENNNKKNFLWDVNNHTSEYVPTKVLRFIEKLLDSNYISFATKSNASPSEEYVTYTASKHLVGKTLDELMLMSQKELKDLLTTDLITKASPVSYIGTVESFGTVESYSIPHLAKYVEYLRRNGSYQLFYKKQQRNEKMMRKIEKTSEAVIA